MYETNKIKIMLTREELRVPIINELVDSDDCEEYIEETLDQSRERLIKVTLIDMCLPG